MRVAATSRRARSTAGFLLAGSLTALGLWYAKQRWLSAGPGWQGPVTDHFDGKRFFNPWRNTDKSVAQLLRWQFTRKRERWPDALPPGPEPRLPDRLAPGDIALTFVGHASWLLQFEGLNLLTDPVWSDRTSPVAWAGPRRVRPPALAWDRLPGIHAVLVSHNHYDHLDVPTLRKLETRYHPLFLTTLGNRAFLESFGLRRVTELDWWESTAIGSAATIHLTPAQHWSNRGGHGIYRSLWGGFYLRVHGRTVYFAGDTGYAPYFSTIRERLGAPQVALLPIGAYEPRWFMRDAHMNPADAVQAHQELGAQRSWGMHYGTWQLTDEGVEAPVEHLAEAVAAAGLGAEVFEAAPFGTTVRL